MLQAFADVDRTNAAAEAVDIAAIFRAESGRSVATLVRLFGSIDVAEEAVQDAFAVAVERRPSDGLPPNPGAWITTPAFLADRLAATGHRRA